MNAFPQIPFTFKKDDSDLIAYLRGDRGKGPFPFLRDATWGTVAALPKEELGKCRKEVLTKLWGQVLTDALAYLKRKDTREFDPQSRMHFDSFFNEESLGIEPLQNVLKAFSDFEGLIYGAKPDRYRDHLVHTFRVWLIGHGLLKTVFRNKLAFDGYAEKDRKGTAVLLPRGEEWQCMWAIAALCHDIGYAVGAVKDVNSKARSALLQHGLEPLGELRFEFSSLIQPLQETLVKIATSKIAKGKARGEWLTHVQNKYFMKLMNAFGALDHGPVSAVLAGQKLVYFLESDYCQDSASSLSTRDAKQYMIRREILRAMAAHTCADIYHLRWNTLPFLLYLVDELQGWGRPTLEQLLGGKYSSHEDDSIRVNAYSKKDIDVEVTLGGRWKGREKGTIYQLGQLTRRLRLAVGATEYLGMGLAYVVKDKGGMECASIRLHDGRIDKEPAELWRSEGNGGR